MRALGVIASVGVSLVALRLHHLRALAAPLTWGIVLCALAPGASACGYHRHAEPRDAPLRRGLVIGDSTMIFATPLLGARGIEADAKECRQFGEGVAIIRSRRRGRDRPHLMILALGANGPVDRAQLAGALRAVGRGRVLGVVTPRNLGGTAAAMRAFARAHPVRVVLIDWARYSQRFGSWFAGDGLHVNQAGASGFARYVSRRVRGVIAPPVGRLNIPRSSRPAKHCGVRRRSGRSLRVHVVRGRSRMTCRRARRLVAGPPLAGLPGWRWYDWGSSSPGPWHDVYVREDRRVVVATVVSRRPGRPRATAR